MADYNVKESDDNRDDYGPVLSRYFTDREAEISGQIPTPAPYYGSYRDLKDAENFKGS